uniref:Uncharacterized protein n=2 Tax=Sexangularia sp. CB-2014 TaxID=1486929 RepID=A0A7S1YHC5_9EUKA|mmetsp:Transcript_3793/g.12257  ORF Transcript_3793/g.12257 Transcript_3793/m.12257 type:complete len:411 (+) Transcript_3793:96-1328(+)
MNLKYLIVPLALLAKILYDSNEWRAVVGPPIRAGNGPKRGGKRVSEVGSTSKSGGESQGEGIPCVTTPFIYPSIGPGGFEDIDVANRVAFSGLDDRRSHKLFDATLLGSARSGALVYMRESDTTWHVLPTNHHANYDKQQRFHPHGLAAYMGPAPKDPEATSAQADVPHLLVVNHAVGGDVVEHYVVANESGFEEALLVGTYSDPLFVRLNDVAPLSDRSFYATNYQNYDSSQWMNLAETLLKLPLQYVVHCVMETPSVARCSKASEHFPQVNSIVLTADRRRAFVTDPLSMLIYVFDVDASSGKLTLTNSIATPEGGCDNLFLMDDGNMLAACHPKLLSFIQHAENPRSMAPSLVLHVDVTSLETKVVLADPTGEHLSASSSAAVLGDRLLVGAVFDPGFMTCTDWRNF